MREEMCPNEERDENNKQERAHSNKTNPVNFAPEFGPVNILWVSALVSPIRRVVFPALTTASASCLHGKVNIMKYYDCSM